jgi:glycosyltransferase involved in cell wall biosynthesis
MLSIIIPSYKDPLIYKTIDSLLENAEGDIEVIPVIDGPWLTEPIKERQGVKTIQLEKNRGARGAFNAGLAEATGDFVMKLDSHCLTGKGYDTILTENCAENWMLVPRRYSLNDTDWIRDERRPIRDYHYISFPTKTKFGYGMWAGEWRSMDNARRDPKYDIDDVMTLPESCWVANRRYFMEHVGFMDDRIETYGSYAGTQQEIGLKYSLGGGELKVIKKTWYAHLSKRDHHYKSGLYERLAKKTPETMASYTWSTKHWVNNLEPNMIHKFEWIIEKFWPVPGWPENWKEIIESYNL